MAINDLADIATTLAYLLRFDIVYGRHTKPAAIEESHLVISGRNCGS